MLVAGEAGIGKTTLIDACCTDMDDAQVLWGACDAALPPRPFAPLADITDTVGRTTSIERSKLARMTEVFEAVLELLRQPRRWAGT